MLSHDWAYPLSQESSLLSQLTTPDSMEKGYMQGRFRDLTNGIR